MKYVTETDRHPRVSWLASLSSFSFLLVLHSIVFVFRDSSPALISTLKQ